ncbi:MAG: methylenetetrahydrofolate--tRNA-(uracil(54)-C(5))-methyltransferase (FADH(2)-oxidizing) TrmFO [Deltaproteobacteria bacterium]|nr:methylenetetrahydrofolate--tRNA-(uracil(54)-C(5))-methyltransferase (FADH(2)-oxidizing) TrmFO [Deltaproteobacteria bacterium]
MERVTVIGGGLAGCEAAWQLARRGVAVTLVEMKPAERTPAHAANGLAELVCSNSLRGASLGSAVGLLKAELETMGSLLVAKAKGTAVPAGRALAVDRARFSRAVEDAVTSHPLVSVERGRAIALPSSGRVIVATGPLTDGKLAAALAGAGAMLHTHDAIAPLVDGASIDPAATFRASRYDEGEDGGDYLNCPMDEAEYHAFVRALVEAEKTPLHGFESAPFFEGCLPVEELAERGPLTLAHGPLKPVGLTDPRTGRRPFAVVQLRQEDAAGTAYNLVGFQTRLTRPEQERVLRTIPGLEKAAFERYGEVHRNSFVDAPRVLDERSRLRSDPRVFVAGQLSGVEGYVESMASGLMCGLFAAAETLGLDVSLPPPTTALGGLLRHLQRPGSGFQPSNVVWAMIETRPRTRGEGKRDHRENAAKQALADLGAWIDAHRALFSA